MCFRAKQKGNWIAVMKGRKCIMDCRNKKERKGLTMEKDEVAYIITQKEIKGITMEKVELYHGLQNQERQKNDVKKNSQSCVEEPMRENGQL